MVAGRPLLYLSLPGVAFVLGLFWLRRRNKSRLENKEKQEVDVHHEANKTAEVLTKSNLQCNSIVESSKSMDINASCSIDDEKSPAIFFGKSAPIQIVPNGRSSPVKQQQKQIECEILKAKISNVENKVLGSIKEDFENLSSPVDLPDSLNNRVSFHSRSKVGNKNGPIVITATRTQKISPENSFLESKYTEKECNQSNNCKLNDSKNQELRGIKEGEDRNENEIEHNGNEKRNAGVASPSLSLCSVQSGDSGKGSSLPRSEATRGKTTYEFFFPTSLIGHLYGRKRSFINQITTLTSAKVLLRNNPFSGKVKICVIEGTEAEINAAYIMIRQRLPTKRYPNFTMQRIHAALPQTIVPLSSENMLNLKLNLIEGINNDVVISSVISGGQIFVQHPLHPSHPSLAVLQKYLYDSYTASEAPLLPGIEIGAVCVLPVNGIWYRVQIVEQNVENDQECVVLFLDFGGYMNTNLKELRQIRSDFMGIPFQATECLLSNIKPFDSCWTTEAADILCKITKGIVLQAQVAGYNTLNIPEVYLFARLGPNNVIFINKELVARKLAKWVDIRN